MRGKFILSYLDFLNCLTLCFAALFVLAYLKMADDSQKGNIIDPAQYIIELTWSEGSQSDIDLWVAGPGGNIVNWQHTDSGVIVLDRDDKGVNNTVDGTTNPIRREVATIRTIIPGTYTVNVMMFKNRQSETEHPRVTIRRLNPYVEVEEKVFELTGDGEELTVLNFDLDEKGNIVSKDDTYTTLVNTQ